MEFLVILAVVLFVSLLAAPVFLHVQEAARRARCLSNLRHIGEALQLYAGANSDRYPFSMVASSSRWLPTKPAAISHGDFGFWANSIDVDIERVRCQTIDAPLAYAYNGYMHALPKSKVLNPKTLIAVWGGLGQRPTAISSPQLDCGSLAEPCGYFDGVESIAIAPTTSVWTHGRGANFLFLDGHAAWRRLGRRSGIDTDKQSDPFRTYDQAGRVDGFWLREDGKTELFRPDAN